MLGSIHVYDLLLCAALLGAAWTALFGRGPFAATVFFIAFGLLLSLVWVQLGASDVALAEASVGAGLTGTLMLGAVRLYEGDPFLRQRRLRGWGSRLVGLLAGILVAVLGWTLWELRLVNEGLLPIVESKLDISGSSHPVTAVLLNFRAFDTWLELGVLLLAALSAIIVDRINRESLPPPPAYPQHPHIAILARTMLPLLIVIGGIMLWFGARSPGGAFQAGALIGASGIFVQLAGQKYFPTASSVIFRAILALGFGTFILVGILTFATGGRFMEYAIPWAGAYILVMEIAATLSIALTLNLLYAITSKVEAPIS
jgi:multisubunit Na+/H+ antiporter MnhB subunit